MTLLIIVQGTSEMIKFVSHNNKEKIDAYLVTVATASNYGLRMFQKSSLK